jgi:glycosyltransferase involved in cell wall biosynthesis
MSTHDLAFLIPTYNRPAQLCILVESILAQLEPVTILISDNSDNYETKNAVEQIKLMNFSHANIVYTKNDGNIGYDANIRNLLHICNTKYMWFVGDDDIVVAGSISLVKQQLKRVEPSAMFVKYTFNRCSTIMADSKLQTTSMSEYIREMGLYFSYLSVNIFKTDDALRAIAETKLIVDIDLAYRYWMHLAISLNLPRNSLVAHIKQPCIINAGSNYDLSTMQAKSDVIIKFCDILQSLWRSWSISLAYKQVDLLSRFSALTYITYHSLRRAFGIASNYSLIPSDLAICSRRSIFAFLALLVAYLYPSKLIKPLKSLHRHLFYE